MRCSIRLFCKDFFIYVFVLLLFILFQPLTLAFVDSLLVVVNSGGDVKILRNLSNLLEKVNLHIPP